MVNSCRGGLHRLLHKNEIRKELIYGPNNTDSSLKNITFKAMMIIPSLLLQEASKNLKSKTIVERQMERQIKLWD